MIPDATRSAVAPFHEWSTWFRVTGDLDSGVTPLVVVHGGPGATHDYLLSIARLALEGRPVIHYDQLGSGASTHLPGEEPGFWTVELFLEELDNLLRHLGVRDDYHLLGQSWGGMLAAEHAVLQPAGLRSLVLSNAPASMELWLEGAKVLRAALPEGPREALDRHEARGTTDDPEYLAAVQHYYDRYVCRVVPNPPEVERTNRLLAQNPIVYQSMFGPNEFTCNGTLHDWSVVERAHRIVAPTLLITGRYDEATPETVQPFLERIADVRWEYFEGSSHNPFVEEPERYRAVVRNFLDVQDPGSGEGRR